jgi:hypothetical protein
LSKWYSFDLFSRFATETEQETNMEDTGTLEKPDAKVTVVAQGDVAEVNFTDGMTLGAAIKLAGIGGDGVADVRVNNAAETNMDRVLEAGDQVHLLRKIRGA